MELTVIPCLDHTVHGRDIDKAPSLLFQYVLPDLARHEKHTVKIHGYGPVPCLVRRCLSGANDAITRIVYQDIDFAVFVDDFLNGSLDAVRIGTSQRKEKQRTPNARISSATFSSFSLRRAIIARSAPRFARAFAILYAKPGRGPGHQGNLAGQVKHILRLYAHAITSLS
jgi:hypothetical protein